MKNKQPAVFIDRDGVVNPVIDRGDKYVVCGKQCRWTAPYSYEEFKIFSFVAEALAVLKEAGFLLILVTNQPDIAYGLLPKKDYEMIMADVCMLGFDDIFVCPHMRQEKCECKKPKPGMLLEAAGKWDIDLSSSYMVGDTETDMLAANAAGCGKFILVNNTHNSGVTTSLKVENLLYAAFLIKKMKGETRENFC